MEKGALKNLQNLQENTYVGISFYLRHSCFSVNFANFQEHLWATASVINIHDIDLSKNVMPVIDIMQMSAGNPFMEIDC